MPVPKSKCVPLTPPALLMSKVALLSVTRGAETNPPSMTIVPPVTVMLTGLTLPVTVSIPPPAP